MAWGLETIAARVRDGLEANRLSNIRVLALTRPKILFRCFNNANDDNKDGYKVKLPILNLAGKWPSRVVRPVYRCPEPGFGVGVVVADARPRERPEHCQPLQPAFQRGCSHGAVIRVEDQRLLAAPTDSLARASPAHQVGRDGWIFLFGDTHATTLWLQTSITRQRYSDTPCTMAGR